MNSIKDLSWLAGLIEGEGCFSTQRNPTKNIYPIITVRMTDKDVIERVAEMWESRINYQKPASPRHKPQWGTRICGEKAIHWMLVLLSDLGERRRAKVLQIVSAWKLA